MENKNDIMPLVEAILSEVSTKQDAENKEEKTEKAPERKVVKKSPKKAESPVEKHEETEEEIEEKEKKKKDKMYKRFISQTLSKFGFSSISSMPPKTKRKFLSYVRKKWNKVDETSSTAGVAGYETPNAFGKQPYGVEKKRVEVLGYKMVNEDFTNEDWKEILNFNLSMINESADEVLSEYIFEKTQLHDGPIVTDAIKILSSYKNPRATKFNDKGEFDRFVNSQTYAGLTYTRCFYTKEDYIAFKNGKTDGAPDDCEMAFQNSNILVLAWDGRKKEGYVIPSNEVDKLLKDSLLEGFNSIYFKDETLAPEKKLEMAIREIKNNLSEIKKIVGKVHALKTEQGINADNIGKKTLGSLKRINHDVIRLMIILNQIK